MYDVNVTITEIFERRSRLVGKLADALDCVDFRRDLGQNGRRIPGARSDFEDLFSALQIQRLRHQGHNIGLGDGLSGSDGKRRVLIGEFPQPLGKKRFPWDLAHRIEHDF